MFLDKRSLTRSLLPAVLAVAGVTAGCDSTHFTGSGDQDQLRSVQVVVDSNPSIRIRDEDGHEIGIDASGLPANLRLAAEQEDPGAIFLLRASVEPPVVNGTRLEASHVVLDGNYAYVSYMVHGDKTIGAVDVFDISSPAAPKLVSSVTLPTTEIAALTVKNGFVYLAGATDDPGYPERAVLVEITLQNKLLTTKTRVVGMPSHFATGVAVLGNKVYVTSGSGGPNTGGLTVLETPSLKKVSGGEAFLDARDVSASGSAFIAAVQGGPAKLHLYSPTTGSLAKMVSLPGGGIPESKSGVVVKDPWAFVATGDGGMQLVDMLTGTIAASLPRPLRAGVDPADAVTNAVSLVDGLILTADGGSGVNVALSNYPLTISPFKPFVIPLGRLDMPGSANFVASSMTSLFVANGLGGLQIIELVINLH